MEQTEIPLRDWPWVGRLPVSSGCQGRPICTRRLSRWQMWKQIDFHSAVMIHKWNKLTLSCIHNHGVWGLRQVPRRLLAVALPSFCFPSCHFLSLYPSLSPPAPSFTLRNLNATSAAQIKSFTVHREERHLATKHPFGGISVFSLGELSHHGSPLAVD